MRFKSLLPWVVALTAASPAWAYIPPSSFIIKSIAAKHSSLKGLKIKSTVTVMDGEKPGTDHFKAVTYFHPPTQTLHAYAYDDAGKKLFAIERKPDSATAADALLFWSDGRALDLALKARGLPIRTEDELSKMRDELERRSSEELRVARWSATVTWVIGDKDGGPSLWVEKDSFLPLRMKASPQPDDDPIEYLFEGQRYYHEFPFPRVLIAVRKKEPLLRDEVQEVLLSMDPNEFKSSPKTGFTDAGNAAPGAVRSLIQTYFDVVR